MTTKRRTITFYYRGLIERGRRYDMVAGYSATSEDGGVLYPWMTKRECQEHARKWGAVALFSDNPPRKEPT